MIPIFNTPFGDIALRLVYNEIETRPGWDPLPNMRTNLERIESSHSYRFHAARRATKDDSGFKEGMVLSQTGLHAQTFRVNNVEYEQLSGSFGVRANEITGALELYQLIIRAQRTDAPTYSTNDLTSKAYSTIADKLRPLLINKVVEHEIALRLHARQSVLEDARKKVIDLQKQIDEYQSAINALF